MKHIEKTTSCGKLRTRVYSTNDEPSMARPMPMYSVPGSIDHF